MARGVHVNTARGDRERPQAALFGPDVTARFCERNRLQLIVRSHQYVREGVKVNRLAPAQQSASLPPPALCLCTSRTALEPFAARAPVGCVSAEGSEVRWCGSVG